MQQIYMTRKDAELGEGLFDSIKWAFESHIQEKDTGEYNFAVMHCVNEDSPAKIELWRNEPKWNTLPDKVWIANDRNIIRKNIK